MYLGAVKLVQVVYAIKAAATTVAGIPNEIKVVVIIVFTSFCFICYKCKIKKIVNFTLFLKKV